MERGTFYGTKKRPFHAVTLQETTNIAEACSSAATSITVIKTLLPPILPPACGDQNIPSDEEDCDQDQQNRVLEPAGEIVVVVVSSSDDEDGHSETERESRRTATRWKKSSTITKTLLSETLPVKIEEKFPELLTKSGYEI